jgi:hypothetical protein
VIESRAMNLIRFCLLAQLLPVHQPDLKCSLSRQNVITGMFFFSSCLNARGMADVPQLLK